jgi:hypothetical protein
MIDEDLQGRPNLPAAWVKQEKSIEWRRREILQNCDKLPRL